MIRREAEFVKCQRKRANLKLVVSFSSGSLLLLSNFATLSFSFPLSAEADNEFHHQKWPSSAC